MAVPLFSTDGSGQLPVNQTGRWSPSTTWSGIAVHMALLPGYGSSYHSKVIWWQGLNDHTTFYGGLWGWTAGNDSCVTFPSSDFTARTFDFPDDDRVFCGSNSQLADGRLFVAGGTQPGTENGMRHSWVFDPATELWAQVDSMARRRWYASSTALADGRQVVASGSSFQHVHFVGGRINNETTPRDTAIWRYGLWGNGSVESEVRQSSTADWPEPREGHTAEWSLATYRVHLFGGKDDSGELLSDVWQMERRLNMHGADFDYAWTKLNPVGSSPDPRYEHAMVVSDTSGVRSTTYMFGGLKRVLGQEVATDEVWKLWRNTSVTGAPWTWTQVTVLSSAETPGARCGHQAVFDPGRRRILVFGGRNSPTASPTDSSVWSFQLSETSDNEGTWSRLTVQGSQLPGPRYDHALDYAVAGWDGEVVMFGGEIGGGNKTNDLWQFNVPNLTWYKITPEGTPPSPRGGASLVLLGGTRRALVFGGRSPVGSTDDTVYVAQVISQHAGNPVAWKASTQLGRSLQNHVGWLDVSAAAFERRPEIFTPTAATGSQWDTLATARFQEWYPQGFVAAPDKVFYAGPADTAFNYRLSTRLWEPVAATPNFKGGSAAMYRPGKIMKCGSNWGPVVGTTKWIDASAPSPQWYATANDMLPRVNHNLVLLPNGQVLVSGGTAVANNSVATDPQRQPEIWDPAWPVNQGRWYGRDTLELDPLIRDYHSTAILLPDGRVLSAGGNANGTSDRKANIFCPPYLFNSAGFRAARPVINSAPQRIRYGKKFMINSPWNTNGQKPCLIRAGAQTHGFDQNQRFVPLAVDTTMATGSQLLVTAPPDSFAAPPGDYLLFILNSNGVPAVARWVRVGSVWAMGDVTAPGAPSTIQTEVVTESTLTVVVGAPGDDGQTGHSWQYDLRWSSDSLHSGNVAGATRVTDERFVPGLAGTYQRTTIKVPNSCSYYFFALQTTDESGNSSSWSFHGPIRSAGCSGGGCGECEARAADARDRRESEDSESPLLNRDAEAASAGSVPDTSSVLIANFERDGSRTTWKVSRMARSEVDGLEPGIEGLLIQSHVPEVGWVTRYALPSHRGEIGIRSLVEAGRVVMADPSSFQIARAPRGFALDSVRSSRGGEVALGPAESATLSPELNEGDTLTLSFEASQSASSGTADQFIVFRSTGGTTEFRAERAAPASPPIRFALHQNRPNPFERNTRLTFTLPHASPVRLDIFDMQGRRVRVLADQLFPAGQHELIWDRRTNSGAIAGPGIYFYRIEAGEHRSRRRMIVLP